MYLSEKEPAAEINVVDDTEIVQVVETFFTKITAH
jgi:hypothetical protein